MKAFLVVTMLALAGGGCATTTTAASGLPAEAVGPDTSGSDGEPDLPGVVITSTSPNDVQFRTDPHDVVLPVRLPVRRSVKPRVHDGMLIGAGAALLLGVMSGDGHHDAVERGECDTLACGGGGPLLGAIGAGAIGLGLGAAAGAIFGVIENALQ